MTNNELKTALQSQCPVVCRSVRHGETRYKCVNAIRYTLDKAKKLIIQAELMDYSNNSITIASGKDVFVDTEIGGQNETD